jgi:hypothetical protein
MPSPTRSSLSISNSRPPVIGVASRQPHLDRHAAAASRRPPALADQGVHAVVVDEELVAQGRDRHQAVGAGLGQRMNRPKRVTPVMRPRTRAHPVGQEGGDIAVGGVALGGHGPALGEGDDARPCP